MAKSPEHTTHATQADDAASKPKRARSPSQPKPIYAVVQLLDENGEPRTDVAKSAVRVVSFEKSAEKVLEIVEGGNHPGAMFFRGMLPAGR